MELKKCSSLMLFLGVTVYYVWGFIAVFVDIPNVLSIRVRVPLLAKIDK
jgi:hypothetical protein